MAQARRTKAEKKLKVAAEAAWSFQARAKWRNLAQKVRNVWKGDLISVEVEGGWVRRPAIADGFLIETKESSVFVTMDQISEATTDRL